MRRFATTLAALLVLAPAAATTAGPAAATTAGAATAAPAPVPPALPAARAVLVACDRAHRTAAFDGRMDAVAGAARMQMRFALQVSTADAPRFIRVRIPGFAAWHTSEPGRPGYVYTKRVQRLVGPAAYRVAVRFRWLAADGTVLRRERELSHPCRQPDPRPDLEVAAVDVRPALRADRRRYAVTLANTGRTAAGASRLSLDLGPGLAPLAAAVAALDPGELRTVVVGGPACAPGAVLTATADATDAVDERDEDDDVLSAPCPG
jgi:hypothetical protein